MPASGILDTVLLLALPASGKSEVRRYLAHLSAEEARRDFHMGETVQLDDFPYVHLMRRVDDELARLGQPRAYFHGPDRPFQDPRDWGTLVHLVNEDYDDLRAHRTLHPASAAALLFDRFDEASRRASARARMSALDDATRKTLATALETESRQLLDDKHSAYRPLEGRTLVIEFARGGPDGAKQPLAAPYGYAYSLGQLSPAILARATILYVWVTPEESRRKNQARTDPNDPGSILHHGVPIEVMLNDYGCDDMGWLEEHARVPGTIPVDAGDAHYDLPIGRFDNRVDKTSFLRGERGEWKPEDVRAVHEGLRSALDKVAAARAAKT